MDIVVALGEKPAASKHGLSSGGKVSNHLLAALSLLAVDCLDIPHDKNCPLANYPVPVFVHAKVLLATDHHLSPFVNEVPQPDFPLSPSGCEIHNNPLAINHPCSPFGNCAGLDINDLEEVIDMVSWGQYFHPVVHTARRCEAFLASNLWVGQSPALLGLPYSYTHQRKGSTHHFAEGFVSTSIVPQELKYKSPVQYVGA
jgi:hypothetical protein